MAGSSFNTLAPDILTENLLSLNSVFKQSYTQAKKQLQDGMASIKEEFLEIYDKAGSYLHKMALPVNNFLKDLTQIEAELLQELNKESIGSTISAGYKTVTALEQTAPAFMEENY